MTSIRWAICRKADPPSWVLHPAGSNSSSSISPNTLLKVKLERAGGTFQSFVVTDGRADEQTQELIVLVDLS